MLALVDPVVSLFWLHAGTEMVVVKNWKGHSEFPNGPAMRRSGLRLSVSDLLVGLSLSLRPATKRTQAHLCLLVPEAPKCQMPLLIIPSLS